MYFREIFSHAFVWFSFTFHLVHYIFHIFFFHSCPNGVLYFFFRWLLPSVIVWLIDFFQEFLFYFLLYIYIYLLLLFINSFICFPFFMFVIILLLLFFFNSLFSHFSYSFVLFTIYFSDIIHSFLAYFSFIHFFLLFCPVIYVY